MLGWRLLIGTIFGISFLCLFYLDWALEKMTSIPGIALFPVMVLLAILCCREMLNLARRNHVFPVPAITYFGILLITFSGWGSFVLPRIMGDDLSVTRGHEMSHVSQGLLNQLEQLTPGNWALSAFALAVILVFLVEIYHYVRPDNINIRISYTVFVMVYIGLFFTFFTLIRLVFGIMALVSFVAIVKMGDIGAFTVGKMFGRNKMAPGLSPGKTVEGAVGAIFFACLTAWVCLGIIIPKCQGVPVQWVPAPEWLCYGAALGFVGMIGDLAESILKRDAEVKDTSSMMPGFGGILDIMDSLLLAAPVAYGFWALELLVL
ncbi:MAG: phosphatidate cytidylyltransferase [Planctomycetia bacterium]|nr:phosphatidate cytidylyltransferase [Planctomycetia bacterium]